ncbi:MAG TPA: helix-turn-helix transcriptional regulator [Candidatus Izemoplasmatales bacterium]|nr:helix-turn-helix transcriptional regulator [Candidatus Izemoplasmatales bacterium]
MLNLEVIGKKIALLRKKNNMNQNDLADKLHVTHQAVSKWENGKSIPSIDVLYDLTQVFHVTIDYLLDDSEIKDDDYDTLLRIYPRESVIRKWMDSSEPGKDIENIFYLLNQRERQFILEQIRLGYLEIDCHSLWHLLSKEERIYVLSLVNNNQWDMDMNKIYHQLSLGEQRFLKQNNWRKI